MSVGPLWADVSCPASFQKIFRNNFAAYTEDTRIRTKVIFASSSTGMLQVNKDIGILHPLWTRISQKNQTHFFMGIQGYEGYEGYESLPEKLDTLLHENTRIQGYQTLCKGYRTKIRA